MLEYTERSRPQWVWFPPYSGDVLGDEVGVAAGADLVAV